MIKNNFVEMADSLLPHVRNSEAIEVKRLMATAEIQRGNYKDCVGFLETLLGKFFCLIKKIENQPKDTEVMKKLALCHQKIDEYDKSESYLLNALRCRATPDEILLRLGYLQFDKQDYDSARMILYKAATANK
jgi:tetratricopeptide (TPR) repeat protein